MNRIHLLSASVANQIAAGEVIERPASVVKELLENALDAGANAISIEIGFGGLNQVKISDNGTGILADDLPLAVAAHATSKINQLNDLYAISSMGFRGEALASIASVSRLSLTSKPADQAHAMMMRIDGEAINLTPCARTQGTTIDVRDLFFNAPVRKKFLKTERSEYQAIEAVVKRFALSAPALALTLKHNDKPTLVLPAASCEQTKLLRIKKLLGHTFVEQAVYLDVERAGMRLHGWVSGRGYQRSQNDKQWIYINRRMVKDKLMNHAMKQAFEGLLYPGRHPSCLLYLTIDADQVDVNVHPTKHEVRFQQPRLVHDFMTSQILAALAVEEREDVVLPSYAIQENLAPSEIHEPSRLCDRQRSNPVGELRTPGLRHVVRKDDYPALTHPWLILNAQFAILHHDNEPWLVNVESLQQRRLIELLTQQAYPLASRPLLVPVGYAIDKANYLLFERWLPMLADLGMQCDFASESRLMVRTIPQLLPSVDIQLCLQALGNMPPMQAELLKRLVTCQSFDARQLTHDEKIEITAYFQDSPAFGLRMDVAMCRGLIHG